MPAVADVVVVEARDYPRSVRYPCGRR